MARLGRLAGGTIRSANVFRMLALIGSKYHKQQGKLNKEITPNRLRGALGSLGWWHEKVCECVWVAWLAAFVTSWEPGWLGWLMALAKLKLYGELEAGLQPNGLRFRVLLFTALAGLVCDTGPQRASGSVVL